jgi:hypothetical protein
MYVISFLLIFLKKTSFFFLRAETPPNTPQRARTAAQQLERSNRTLDSPQRHRTPHQPTPPLIPPLNFNVPPPPPVVIPGDDPFALPAPAPEPVRFNGHQYQHLPQHLAEALQNLAPVPAPPQRRGRGRGISHAHIPPNPPVSYIYISMEFIRVIFEIASSIPNPSPSSEPRSGSGSYTTLATSWSR